MKMEEQVFILNFKKNPSVSEIACFKLQKLSLIP